MDKHGLTTASPGCDDTGDASGLKDGGGCVDLRDCTAAESHKDNRTQWLVQSATCTPTWSQCGGSGFTDTPCCDAKDACKAFNGTSAKIYASCQPK